MTPLIFSPVFPVLQNQPESPLVDWRWKRNGTEPLPAAPRVYNTSVDLERSNAIPLEGEGRIVRDDSQLPSVGLSQPYLGRFAVQHPVQRIRVTRDVSHGYHSESENQPTPKQAAFLSMIHHDTHSLRTRQIAREESVRARRLTNIKPLSFLRSQHPVVVPTDITAIKHRFRGTAYRGCSIAKRCCSRTNPDDRSFLHVQLQFVPGIIFLMRLGTVVVVSSFRGLV